MPEPRTPHSNDDERLEAELLLFVDGALDAERTSAIEARAAEGGELVAESNFLIAELAIQAKHEVHWWVGRATHRLRRVDGALRMSEKTVVLINAAEPLPNLSFLI